MESELGGDPGARGAMGKATSRRTVLKAGAWSAPVIALAVASPAAAASTAASIELVSGPFEGVDVGDPIPLVFSVTGVADGVTATGTILTGDTVVEWQDGGTIAFAAVADGMLFFPATVLSHGTFQVEIAVGGAKELFTITVSAG
ncbi:MAG: hypothetical protein QM708_11575 [Propioniciclava sp.]|uniref:hypothetical protein n=1 Tax=Propioniciclava sp. TaxID=2038686 RepID=UPI0039E3C79C